MDREGQFVGISGRIKGRRRRMPGKIGGPCREYVQSIKTGIRGASAAAVFNELLPEPLAAGCRVESVSRGVMQVRVLPGVYMFQMQSISSALLEEIKKQCPRAAIREIKLLPKR
ncbi:MAG: DUF721 domain-containing protein [Anaerohalosphaeraceae bacterium]|nr:DUF721 domain-containing protein [Anaerohalosphaeraceae bacterium]